MLEFSARPLKPNDLFALQYVHDARISPDGQHVAYVISRTLEETGEEVFEMTLEQLATGSRRKLSFSGRVSSPRWSPAGSRIAFVGIAGGASRLYIADASSLEFESATPTDLRVQGPPAWSPDGSSIACTVATQCKPEVPRRITRRVFRAEGVGDIDDLTLGIELLEASGNHRARRLGLKNGVAMQPSFSPCGRKILFLGSEAAAGYPPLQLKLFVLDLADDHLTELLGDHWYIAAASWTPCGSRIVFAGDYASELTVPILRLWVMDCHGSKPECRTQGLTANVGLHLHHDMPTWATSQNNVFAVPDSFQAFATVTNGGCAEILRIALDGPIRLEPVISGERACIILDANAQTSQLAFASSTLSVPWNLHIACFEGQAERQLTHLNDSVLADWPALSVRHLSFQSADAQPLEGWFLYRSERVGPQPVVMFIHGGPELAVGHIFRFDFQMLAANGYAVLFANFRGSSGYGDEFRKGLLGKWGERGFPDHEAAVNAAIEAGMADSGRLGVWGPSFGGFSTCWIVCHTQRFRAAVAESAVTNLSTLYYICDVPDIFVREFGGRPDQVPEVYRIRSPLTYACECRTPTLMLHGEADLRCSIVEAEQFYRALHDVGCKTELVRVPGMTHMGDSTGPLSVRLAQNEALLDWFERHL